jgi:hypothetical protein
MAETALELGAILEAAERAVSVDDFVSAERHLRQAAALQEQQIGARHPDLANTLNNLGIVYEHLGKPAEAEECYRRAYGIASTALPPDHPLVETSGQNLRDFCEAIGKPVELSGAPPGLEPFAPEQGAPTPVARHPESPSLASLPLRPATETRPAEPPPRKPTEATRTASPVSQLSPPSSRPTTAIAMGAVILLAFGTWWFGFRQPSRPAAPSTPRVETPSPREQAPPPANAAAEPAPIPAPPETPAPTGKPAIAAPPVKRVAPETTARGDVSVAEAKLCRSLTTSNWTCTAATSPPAPGAFFFYTRVKSARDTTVQHRWLMNGRLVRSIDLKIKANPKAGYRTYSRNTVSGERRSDWTIELRDAGGALLHEERFTVQ